MREKIMAVVDGIRCAETKIAQCRKEREDVLQKVGELDSAIAHQERSRLQYEAALDVLLANKEVESASAPSDHLRRKMLDDLVAQRAAITRKINELEAEAGF